jgi:hypothetical protein
MNGLRSFLYAFAKILGDMNALNKGKVGKRVARRYVGKQTQKGINKLFK